MRLEVGSIAIQNLEFGGQTAIRDHTLVVNRDEIRQLVLEDRHFSDVEAHIARPGESVRIVHALNVAEPRWKVAGPGGIFPGFVSPPTAVGEGRTHRLAGVAVVDTGDPVPGEPTFWRERVIDMVGPGAQYCPFGQTLNLVLHYKPNMDFFPPGSDQARDVLEGGDAAAEYNRAMLAAGLKVAARLAQVSQDSPLDQLEAFELAPCDPDLPRVVVVQQFLRRLVLYGVPVPLPLGTLVHPNEFFDGAVIGGRGDTLTGSIYWEQNSEILMQLCRLHGTALSFAGCLLFSGVTPLREDKERVSSAIAKLARLLGARGAVFLGVNGSNYAVDLMWAIQKCERADIRTVLAYSDQGYGPDDPGFVFSVPEADAIVCTGSRDQVVTLPRLEKVLGGNPRIGPDMDASGELAIAMRYLHSAFGTQGYNRLTTRFE